MVDLLLLFSEFYRFNLSEPFTHNEIGHKRLKYVKDQINVSLDSEDASLHDRNKNAVAKNIQEHNSDLSIKRSIYDSSFQYPVRIGDEYDVNIQDMSRNGDSGVARIRGLITFVRGTKPDDKVRIKITKVGKGYARGQMIAYLDSKK
jgi:predicted RNA-binding protein with TRAM domain